VSVVHVVVCCGVCYRSVLFRVLDIGENGSCMSSCSVACRCSEMVMFISFRTVGVG
jgi:hypothetical protein